MRNLETEKEMKLAYLLFHYYAISTELWQPKGPLSGAPCLYTKTKETQELIFSWLSWLAVLLVGMYA